MYLYVYAYLYSSAAEYVCARVYACARGRVSVYVCGYVYSVCMCVFKYAYEASQVGADS